MKHLLIAVVAALALAALPALAADPAASVDLAAIEPGRAPAPVNSATIPAYLDEDLASKYADFSRFAKAWIRTSNQHHVLSRNRMQIRQEADGTYSAIYHRSDENDMVCTVKKSTSGIYTAILRYKEIIYKSIAASPQACRAAEFLPSLVNRRIRIFKLKGNSWE
ncbi:hypothetical protein [Pseudodesulfovibrio sp.]|uniref:hypothetical protein n=1 Tax=Pseudodesulfovibrio sp. TaxID=2035812 RepID=UPI00260FB578|nr:hypothetical protein [Pseudodesulfovibrio sp.]MDD3311356.1 hypothetical protein [Pseudodesulfovibrio sp.]